MLDEPGSRLRARVLAACIAGALALGGCATRGHSEPGWVTVSQRVRYRTTALSGRSLRLEVAYVRAAYADEDDARAAARAAFRHVAIDELGDAAFDDTALAIAEETAPSGVRTITVASVVAP